MAKNTTRMPMSSAGLTNFQDEYHSKIVFKPGHVVVFCILVILIIAALHIWGNGILGLA